ncbi:hypothetical protein DYB25_006878 [Aphanomyces astaci]|uniref:EamA domain-containing protein n=1 Tax=Aphanomyces astaci TaxID=112090 RepID=A0A397ACR2_APHAT|nr:hypothetical protein DYB25_006878 [Aphanomyces astaci]
MHVHSGMYMFPQGLLGGCLFALANVLIPTVVNTLGLGVGFMLWNGANITMGYLVSRFGLFGVHPTVPAHPWLSALGIVFMLASIVVYGMVQPKLSNHVSQLTSATRSSTDPLVDVTAVDETTPLKHKDHSPASSSDSILDLDLNAMANENLTESFIHPELPNYGWTLLLSLVSHTIHLFLGPFSLPAEVPQHVAIANAEDERKRKYIGVALALLLGGILGNCLTPYVLWQQSCTAAGGCNPLNFLFSQCMGIYVTSTVCFLIYASFFRYHKRSMPRSAMRPAYVSGLLWATGLAGQLLSAGNLGFDLVYPLTSIGPAMVSMLWSAIYFKEIEGKRNMSIMALGTAMIFTGTLLRAVAA